MSFSVRRCLFVVVEVGDMETVKELKVVDVVMDVGLICCNVVDGAPQFFNRRSRFMSIIRGIGSWANVGSADDAVDTLYGFDSIDRLIHRIQFELYLLRYGPKSREIIHPK